MLAHHAGADPACDAAGGRPPRAPPPVRPAAERRREGRGAGSATQTQPGLRDEVLHAVQAGGGRRHRPADGRQVRAREEGLGRGWGGVR